MLVKILVTAKRVIDYHVKVRVKSDQSAVDLQNVKMAINPFDEIAAEAAIQLKEKNIATDTVVVSIGPAQAKETLQHALAMGIDRGILIDHADALEPINTAKILQAIISTEKPDLVIMGKQAIDDDCNQTGQMLAAIMNWPQACFASKIEYCNDQWQVTREIDGGLESLAFKGPGVITSDMRLNQPRFISLPNIMKAKSKSIETVTVNDLGLELKARQKIMQVEPPAERGPATMLQSVEELINTLKAKEVIA